MGQVGVFISELLEVPVVTAVAALSIKTSEKKAGMQRSLERGNREAVECSLPAVLTVDKNLNRPRYPTLPGRVRAQKMPVKKIKKEHLEPHDMSEKVKLVNMAPPRLRPKKILAPESGLSAANRLQFVMSGGVAQKKGGQIGGNPDAMATGIFNFLKEKNFLPENEMEN
jgi:electron transfer flavoprotein beta subunit